MTVGHINRDTGDSEAKKRSRARRQPAAKPEPVWYRSYVRWEDCAPFVWVTADSFDTLSRVTDDVIEEEARRAYDEMGYNSVEEAMEHILTGWTTMTDEEVRRELSDAEYEELKKDGYVIR